MELSNYTLVHLSFALSGKLINIFQRCSRTRRRPKCTFSFLFIEGLISFVASTVALNYLTLRYLSPYIWDWKKVLPNDPHWKGCQLQKAWMALRSNIWRLNVSKLAKVEVFSIPFLFYEFWQKHTCLLGWSLMSSCLHAQQESESWMLLPQQLLARFLLLRAPCRVSYNNKRRVRLGLDRDYLCTSQKLALIQ